MYRQSVTLGDEEARKRKVQKTILERKGPPTFTCAVEMVSKTECRVHHRLDATVDAILAGTKSFDWSFGSYSISKFVLYDLMISISFQYRKVPNV